MKTPTPCGWKPTYWPAPRMGFSKPTRAQVVASLRRQKNPDYFLRQRPTQAMLADALLRKLLSEPKALVSSSEGA